MESSRLWCFHTWPIRTTSRTTLRALLKLGASLTFPYQGDRELELSPLGYPERGRMREQGWQPQRRHRTDQSPRRL